MTLTVKMLRKRSLAVSLLGRRPMKPPWAAPWLALRYELRRALLFERRQARPPVRGRLLEPTQDFCREASSGRAKLGRAAGGAIQSRFDTVYAQCMAAKGNNVEGPPVAPAPVVYGAPGYISPPRPVYGAPASYYY